MLAWKGVAMVRWNSWLAAWFAAMAWVLLASTGTMAVERYFLAAVTKRALSDCGARIAQRPGPQWARRTQPQPIRLWRAPLCLGVFCCRSDTRKSSQSAITTILPVDLRHAD